VHERQDSLVDPETGLFDARYFMASLRHAVAAAKRRLQPMSVVILTFAADEEREGHSLADRATFLRDILRGTDTLCRLEGDRLGLILEEATEHGALLALERIRRQFDRLSAADLDPAAGTLGRHGLPGSAQPADDGMIAGIASYPTHALEANELVSEAERALARARTPGTPRIAVAPTD
jgi:GGDEF domain-containing protein